MNRLQKLIKKYLDLGLTSSQADKLAVATIGRKPTFGMRRSFKIAMKGKSK